VPDGERITFRIGINQGDIIIDGDDIYGDGINIAARLQEIASPGGIVLSASAYEGARRHLDASFQDLGPQSLKNISDPIQAYRVVLGGETPTAMQSAAKGRRTALWSILIVVVIVATAGLWRLIPRDTRSPPPANVEDTMRAFEDKPSIAVLPFQNMSGDPDQEYFVDGMVEDIITDLSKLQALFVIARNSTFQYKGKRVDIAKVGKELGVRYVLEGSVRRAGKQVRINAQLIDVTTGGHLWAERYDGDLRDVFELQDQMTRKIVSSLALVLDPPAKQALTAKDTDNPDAYDAFLRGMRHLNVHTVRHGDQIFDARKAFKQAVALDPNFARAYAGLGMSYWDEYALIDIQRGGLKDTAAELADKSLALQENALAYRLKARRYFAPYITGTASYMGNQHELAIAELKKALALEPNNADVMAELAYTMVFASLPTEALDLMRRAKRLNPNFPKWYFRPTGIAYFLVRDYAKAIPELTEWAESELSLGAVTNLFTTGGPLWLASAYALAGKPDKARATLAKIKNSLNRKTGQQFKGPKLPKLYVSTVSRLYAFAREEDWLHLRDGLIKAGLKEAPE